MIASANEIDGQPYKLGGGHAGWISHGYDCSGSVSYALHGAELLPAAMVSGEFEDWGADGVGRWITVYANPHHAYMIVAGLRYDTKRRSRRRQRAALARRPGKYAGPLRGPPPLEPLIRDRLRAAAAALASTAILFLAATPAGAAAEAVPWGMSCRPSQAGVTRTSATCGATLVDGTAIAPPGAPPTVVEAIAAANQIDGRPYVWGGGHLSWTTRGYDCSGAVSYALHGADLLSETMVSGQLEHWGSGGVGRWITVYANYHHVYMVIAGLRYDTRDDPPGVSGPRWHTEVAPPGEFAARHPLGL